MFLIDIILKEICDNVIQKMCNKAVDNMLIY